MASSAIDNDQFKGVTMLITNVILTIGLLMVTYAVFLITESKFTVLKERIEQSEGFKPTVNDRTKQLECLAKNIYWEAANEPFEGKVAVAQVTMNRVNDGRFGTGVCGVVYQKNIIYEKLICQFSWVCETNHKVKPLMPKQYAESEEVAKKVLLENFRLPGLNQAMYYHATYVNPGWKKEKISQIGQHIFYKD